MFSANTTAGHFGRIGKYSRATLGQQICPSHGKTVPQEVCGHTQSGVWVSDALQPTRPHAAWQLRITHLLRDAQYTIGCCDAGFSAQFKRWLLRALAIGQERFCTNNASTESSSRTRRQVDQR